MKRRSGSFATTIIVEDREAGSQKFEPNEPGRAEVHWGRRDPSLRRAELISAEGGTLEWAWGRAWPAFGVSGASKDKETRVTRRPSVRGRAGRSGKRTNDLETV